MPVCKACDGLFKEESYLIHSYPLIVKYVPKIQMWLDNFKELFKFFDKDGNTLVLRPDFTPSIARCAAKYYLKDDEAVKLCYMGNTFSNST